MAFRPALAGSLAFLQFCNIILSYILKLNKSKAREVKGLKLKVFLIFFSIC